MDSRVYDFPDVNDVKGILIYTDWATRPGFSLEGNGLQLVIGDRDILQRILRTKLKPSESVNNPTAVRRISQAYSDALDQYRRRAMNDPRGARTIGSIGDGIRIAFITSDRIYLRDMDWSDMNMTARDQWMSSKQALTELMRVGFLRWTCLNLWEYDFPDPQSVIGVLMYRFSPVTGGLDLALIIGDRDRMKHILHEGDISVRQMDDPNVVARISTLYYRGLAAAHKTAQSDPNHSGYRILSPIKRGVIAFVTTSGCRRRELCVDQKREEAGDGWMMSHALYQEFVKIGYLKE